VTKNEILQQVLATRLPKGKGLRGPEVYGCINSGFAPTITHLDAGDLELWIVGPSLTAREVCKKLKRAEARVTLLFHDEKQEPDLHRRVWRFENNPNLTVWTFRSKRPAAEKFADLCATMLKINEAERKAHKQALKDALSEDPVKRTKGAWNLLDF